jgi:hypothetical protein
MKRYLFCIAIISILFSCNGDRKYASSDYAENRSVVSDSTSSDTTATPKIIKTADMRFRVKDVQQTKENLSATIKAQGGTITEFVIESVIQESDKVKYSLDSLKEITSYRKEGTLIAKVPSEKLDDFTNIVAKMAVFVDNQSMKMDDQSVTYLANKLKAQNRIAALNTIKKTATRKGNNVETAVYLGDDYIDKKIENMNIDNKVKFSTITLNFYQDNTVNTLVVANDRLSDYGPGFFQRLGLNLFVGWSFFKEFILSLATIWPLFAVGIALFLIIRFLIKRRKTQ